MGVFKEGAIRGPSDGLGLRKSLDHRGNPYEIGQGGKRNERRDGAADDGGGGATGGGDGDAGSRVGKARRTAGDAECESGADRGGGRGKHYANQRAAP